MIEPIQAHRSAAGSVTPTETGHARPQGDKATERHVEAKHGSDATAPAPVASVGARVTFSVDAQLRQTIIKVIDPDTGKVIRQIPQESRLRMQRAYVEEQARHPEADVKVEKSDVA